MYSAYLVFLSCDASCLSGDAASNRPIFNRLDDMKVMTKLLGVAENWIREIATFNGRCNGCPKQRLS